MFGGQVGESRALTKQTPLEALYGHLSGRTRPGTHPAGATVGDNFYWLSTTEDEMDFENSEWHGTPIKRHADLTALRSLPEATVIVQHDWQEVGEQREVRVRLENPSDTIAFALCLNVARKGSGESVLPIRWDDNYVSLLPGRSRELSARFWGQDVGRDEPMLETAGWNVRVQAADG